MQLKHGFARAAALAVLLAGTSPMALMAETPADTLVIADAIDDIVSIDPHEAFEFSGVDLNNNVYDTMIELDPATEEIVGINMPQNDARVRDRRLRSP